MTVDNEPDYSARVREEIEHYNKIYKDDASRATLTQSVPLSWTYIEAKADKLIRNLNDGRSFVDEIVSHIRACGGGRVLSIGSGPGGLEMDIARHISDVPYEIVCLDLNPNLVSLGQERATLENLNVRFVVQDVNELSLGSDEYDVIICFASLHHLLNLEHVCFELNRSLKPTGKLVVVDIITRNGYLMWDETYTVVQSIWAFLPEKYKLSHTGYAEPRVDLIYENRDYGSSSMECVRSEEILSVLSDYFECKIFIPLYSISRRFFDTMYGPNYDLSKELDKSILDMIWNLDLFYLTTNALRPETMFGVYTKGLVRQRPQKYVQTQAEKLSA